MPDKNKILVISILFHGHFNPMNAVVSHLTDQFDCTFYLSEEFRTKIEAAGATLQTYSHPYGPTDPDFPSLTDSSPADLLTYNLKKSLINFEGLRDFVLEFKPSLILVDSWGIIARLLFGFLTEKHRLGELDFPKPKFVMFFSIMTEIEGGVRYLPPSVLESKPFQMFIETTQEKMLNPFNAKMKTNLTLEFSKLGYTEEFGEMLNISCILKEFHPHAELYENKVNFVGMCSANSQVRQQDKIQNTKLAHLLSNENTNKKLIYVSMGTTVNFMTDVFTKIVKTLGKDKYSKEYEVIVSCKDPEKLPTPLSSNILVLPSCPQIDILAHKQTALFVTHCGQNSTSETIHHGVPIVGLPVFGDQPFVARRMCLELKCGVQINAREFTVEQFEEAVDEVLLGANSKTYKENVLKLSEQAKKTDGAQTAAKLIAQYIQ
jgi:MGT family glycosyltransferase